MYICWHKLVLETALELLHTLFIYTYYFKTTHVNMKYMSTWSTCCTGPCTTKKKITLVSILALYSLFKILHNLSKKFNYFYYKTVSTRSISAIVKFVTRVEISLTLQVLTETKKKLLKICILCLKPWNLILIVKLIIQ